MSRIINYIFGSGRISRTQFIVLFVFFATISASFVSASLYILLKLEIYNEQNGLVVYSFVSIIALLVFIFPVVQRRGNDIGLIKILSYIYVLFLFFAILKYFSGLTIFLNPILSLFYFLFPGNKSKNKYGEVPKNTWNFGKVIQQMWLNK